MKRQVSQRKNLLYAGCFAACIGVVSALVYWVAATRAAVLPGDINSDNKVDVTDLSILLANYGKSASQSTNPAADINGNGTVEIIDLSVLLTNYGKQGTATCNYYVATNGSDAANGSVGAPFRTLSRANGAAAAGQTVCVRGGVYAGERPLLSTSGTAVQPITYKAYPGEQPIYDGQGNMSGGSGWTYGESQFKVTGSNIVLDGLEIRNSLGIGVMVWMSQNVKMSNLKVHDVWHNAFFVTGDGHVVEDSEVYNSVISNLNGRTGSSGWPTAMGTQAKGANLRSTNITFRRNNIHNNWGEGLSALFVDRYHFHDNVIRDSWSVNIYLDNSADGIVERNFSYKTSAWTAAWTPRALCFGNEAYSNFSNPRPTENIVVRNNFFANSAPICNISQRSVNDSYRNIKFVGNTLFNQAVAFGGNHASNQFVNNIMDGQLTLPAGWSVANNAFPLGNTVGSNAVTAPPQYVNSSLGTPEGLRLQATSALKGKGMQTADLTDDYWKQNRRTPPTIGAHEL